MSERQQSTVRLSDAMKAARETYETIRDTLIDSLAPYQKSAHLIMLSEVETTTSDMAVLLGVSQTQASNVLKELHDLGLLERRCRGNAYIYKVRR